MGSSTATLIIMEGLNIDLERRPQPPTESITCCCGRPDCVLLKKNCTVLETVEKDVHTAAQLGQVSLCGDEFRTAFQSQTAALVDAFLLPFLSGDPHRGLICEPRASPGLGAVIWC